MKKAPQVLSMKPTVEDWKLVAAISKKLGVQSFSDLFRMALRALAAKEGVTL
jgi:hypothetical protein